MQLFEMSFAFEGIQIKKFKQDFYLLCADLYKKKKKKNSSTGADN